MRLCNDNVLIVEDEASSVTNGGIILPEGTQKKLRQGTVIAVGPGAKLEDGGRYKMDIEPGSVVFYPERVGDAVKIDGHEYLCIPERFIAGVLLEAERIEENEDE